MDVLVDDDMEPVERGRLDPSLRSGEDDEIIAAGKGDDPGVRRMGTVADVDDKRIGWIEMVEVLEVVLGKAHRLPHILLVLRGDRRADAVADVRRGGRRPDRRGQHKEDQGTAGEC